MSPCVGTGLRHVCHAFHFLPPHGIRRRCGQNKESNTGLSLLVVLCVILYVLTFWRTQHFLDLQVERNTLPNQLVQNSLETVVESVASLPSKKKYIVFLPAFNQGEGNVMNGLLAAHLLGLEFGRIVCVSTIYESFLSAFEPIHQQFECSTLPQVPQKEDENSIQLFNYDAKPPNECHLQSLLASDQRVLYFTGNTYPRFRSIPPNFFFRCYRPTNALLEALPPHIDKASVVVHLRQPDLTNGDSRRGLDDETFQVLGQSLPSNTFLVTNRVAWYDYFQENFGWSHPGWRLVRHSAKGFSWGKRETKTRHKRQNRAETQYLQLWSDWYTMLRAKRVYHTHSDFSLSAIHWMSIESKTIMGVTQNAETITSELDLWEECWRREGETPPLVDRTAKNLLNCSDSKKNIHLERQSSGGG